MKTTIEEINGVAHTVVWHDADFAINFEASEFTKLDNGSFVFLLQDFDNDLMHIATALPPLPINPTVDDAKLLSLYAAHGLIIMFGKVQFCCAMSDSEYIQEITHAINEAGEWVEIAIIDREGN